MTCYVPHYDALVNAIRNELRGVDPNAEPALKAHIQRMGINLYMSMVNGPSPSLRVLQERQYKGMSPNEEGNVDEYLQKIGLPRVSTPRPY